MFFLDPGGVPQELGAGERTRIIYSDRQRRAAGGHEFVSNRVVTSKYNIVTFLPIFLFEMFSRVAYLYFLLQVGPAQAADHSVYCCWVLSALQAKAVASRQRCPLVCIELRIHLHPPLWVASLPLGQAGLSWWSVISPFSGYGSTAALVFVLAVAAVKAIWEDVKRHHEDNRMNTSITHRVEPDGEPQRAANRGAAWQGNRWMPLAALVLAARPVACACSTGPGIWGCRVGHQF